MSPRLRQLLGILVPNSNVVVWTDRRVEGIQAVDDNDWRFERCGRTCIGFAT